MPLDLPVPPDRIARLPLDHRGYPVPWFVATIDGKPDFRVVRPGGQAIAHNRGLCWLCGQPRGTYMTFTIGPMCAVNRISSEPPSHRECAEYAVHACPFMLNPHRIRNDVDMPSDTKGPPGEMIARNPGVTLLWTTKSYKVVRDPKGGALFEIGPPTETGWYARGRAARRDEILESIRTGLPLLRKSIRNGDWKATAELDRMLAAAMKLVPA